MEMSSPEPPLIILMMNQMSTQVPNLHHMNTSTLIRVGFHLTCTVMKDGILVEVRPCGCFQQSPKIYEMEASVPIIFECGLLRKHNRREESS